MNHDVHMIPRCNPWSLVVTLVMLSSAVPGCGRSTQDRPAPESIPTDAETTHKDLPSPPRAEPTISGTPTTPSIPQSLWNTVARISPQIGSGHFNGQRDVVVDQSQMVRMLAVSSDGRFIVVGRQVSRYGAALQVWEAQTGRLVNEVHEPSGITSLALAPDSQSMAYGAGDGSVVFQPLPTGQASRVNEHRQPVGDLVFSPDGSRLATFGHDNQLIIWDPARATVIQRTFSGDARFALRVQFANPDQIWALSSDGIIRWHGFNAGLLAAAKEVKVPEGFRILTADGTRLHGLQQDGRPGTVDPVTGQGLPIPKFSPRTGTGEFLGLLQLSPRVAAMSVVASSHAVACCTTDGRLTLLNEGGTSIQQSWDFGIRAVDRISCDQNGRLWTVHSTDGNLVVFDRDQPDSRLWLERAERLTHGVRACFNPEVRTVTSLRDPQGVVVSDLSTGMTLRRLTIPQLDNAARANVTALLAGHAGTVYCGTSDGVVMELKPETRVLKPGTQPSGTPLTVSQSVVTALAESPDGRTLLAGNHEGKTTWLDPQNVFPPISFHEHSSSVCAIRFSRDGRWVATASADHSIIVWDVAKRSRSQILHGHHDSVQAVNFSPDSRWIVSGDRTGTTIIWNVETAQQVWSGTLRNTLVQREVIVKTPLVNGTRPTSATTTEGTEPATQPGRRPENGMDRGITSATFSPDQRVLAIGTAAGYTQTFDLVRARELSAVFHRSAISDLAFAPDGASLLVATERGSVVRWWRAPDSPRLLSGHTGMVRFAVLDASGKRAVTGGHDKQFRVWDVDQGALVQTLDNQGEAIACGALSPDGHRAVTAGFGSGIVFWDLAQMKRLTKRYGHGKRVWSLALSSDGNTVASGSDDETVKIWDFATQKMRHTIPHDAPVHFVAFSPDGTTLLTSTLDRRGWKFPARLRLWDVATGRALREFRGHRSSVTSAVFNEAGSEITSCGSDGQVRRWNALTDAMIGATTKPHGLSHLRRCHNGRYQVIERFNDGIYVELLASRSQVSEFSVPTRSIGDLDAALNGSRIIVGTEEGPVYVWSLGDE